MKFPYGISPASLVRWRLFERISELRTTYSAELGQDTMIRVVGAELAAIEQATAQFERCGTVRPGKRG